MNIFAKHFVATETYQAPAQPGNGFELIDMSSTLGDQINLWVKQTGVTIVSVSPPSISEFVGPRPEFRQRTISAIVLYQESPTSPQPQPVVAEPQNVQPVPAVPDAVSQRNARFSAARQLLFNS